MLNHEGLSPIDDSGGEPTVPVQPLCSQHRNHLVDRDLVVDPVLSLSAFSSPSSSTRHLLHGPPQSRILPLSPLPAASAVTTRPRSAPPRCPSLDMAWSDQEFKHAANVPEGHNQPDVCTEHSHPAPASRARGTQVKPSELPREPSPPQVVREPYQSLTLSDLSNQLRSDNEHARRRVAVEVRLHDLQVAAARTKRILQIAQPIRHVLAECIRTEDKLSFVHLLSAFRHAIADAPTLDDELPANDTSGGHEELHYPESFIDALSEAEQTAVCDLLTKVKTDPSFLAARIGALNRRDFSALLPEKLLTKPVDSVFASSQRSSSRLPGQLEGIVDGLTVSLANFDFTSPLETLILSGRTLSSCSLKDDPVAKHTWAEVCASLLVGQVPGVEKLIPAVVDIWASNSPWPGKDNLELWILQTLQNGSFLLERPAGQTFQMRVQGKREPRPEDELRREAFFAQAVDSLLDLLGDSSGPSMIPDGAFSFCAAVHERLKSSPGHQSAFAGFIATRWLVSSFLPDALTLPETCGIASDHYISEHARSRILREVAARARRTILDAVHAWKLGGRLSVQTVSRVEAVLKRFHSTAAVDTPNLGHTRFTQRSRSVVDRQQEFTVISSADIRTIFNALYPVVPASSFISDRDSLHSGLRSSASSISGFSLFKNAVQSEHSSALFSSPIPELAHLMVSDNTSPNSSWCYPVTEVEQFHVKNDSAEVMLRTACNAIDEFVVGADDSRTSQWAVLMHSKGNPLRSARKDFVEIMADSQLPSYWANHTSREHKTCRTALIEVLEDADGSCTDSALLISPEVNAQGLDQLIEFLFCAFEQRRSLAEERSEFLAAHTWFRHLQTFQTFVAQDVYGDSLISLLGDISSVTQARTGRAADVIKHCTTAIGSLRSDFQAAVTALNRCDASALILRNKMWYVADVRISSAYDEARSISSALLVMGKPRSPSDARSAPPLRQSFSLRSAQIPLHLKTEAQVVDILSAMPRYGGPNKLSDDQTRALLNWMDQNHIENLCRGEERLQKLCMEIRKCADMTLVGNPDKDVAPLWSWMNPLFADDARFYADGDHAVSQPNLYAILQSGIRGYGINHKRSDVSVGTAVSTTSQPLSNQSSRDYLESRSPTWTTGSSVPFWSPAVTEAQTMSSSTSIIASSRGKTPTRRRTVGRRRHSMLKRPSRDEFVAQLRQQLISFLLSDLTTVLFCDGSETDKAFWSGLGGELLDKHLQTLQTIPYSETSDTAGGDFQFEKAYRKLIRRFSLSSCPSAKLRYIHSVDSLLERQHGHAENTYKSGVLQSLASAASGVSPIDDLKVDRFRRLFADSTTRPSSIFRDMQVIAALVSSHTLESTPQGRSFWNAVVAISGLKQEVRTVMVETADGIIAYHSNNRGHGRASSTAQQQRDSATFTPPARTPSAEDIARYTMADAAYLLQITAKEGDPVAQRELATLYLTHPDLMCNIIAPFARPRDVFKEELEGKWRKNQDPNRCDPTTMCVAHHWMMLSAKGGDALAEKYLRQREEMDKLP